MKQGFTKLLDVVQRLLVIAVLLAITLYFFSGGRFPLKMTQSDGPPRSGMFSHAGLLDRVARLEVSGTSFLARSEAKRLIKDGITDVQYFPSPKPTVTVRIRCGIYKGHEATWAAVLEHYSRYYCFKENMANIEGRIVNCENRAILGKKYSFEE